MEAEGIPVLLVDPDWPRHSWYAGVVCLVRDSSDYPLWEELLSQGPVYHPSYHLA